MAGRVTIAIIFVLITPALYGQLEGIDRLKLTSDEILLIKVTNDSSFFLMENFRCFSSAYGDVVEIFKRSKISSDRKKVIVFHSARCNNGSFPPSMKLVEGKQYFVFLSTDGLNAEDVKNDRDSEIRFPVSDNYLGILAYNEDLYWYLKRVKSELKKDVE